MTNQHRATPEQWHWKMMEELAPQNDRSPLPPCILELRARVEALEAKYETQRLATASADHSSDGFQTLCAYARNYIEEREDKEAVDELERIIASLSQRLATNV